MMNNKTLLKIDGITKSFGGLLAVKNLSFDIQKGEIVGLMGPNGAGKTTLLNIITGEYKPDSGIIKFGDINITGLSPHKICRLGISRTYQIPQPFLNLSILQNSLVSARFGAGLNNIEGEKLAKSVLELVGLSDKKNIAAKNLTAIELKMLELARALSAKPSLLLLDEVAAGLSGSEIPWILNVLDNIRNTGITFLLIEHVTTIMTKAVDKIVVMDKGEKLAEGKPEDVFSDQKVIQAYLG